MGSEITRREVLKRGAVVGGALWAAPTVQSLTNAAHAQGSPGPTFGVCCQCVFSIDGEEIRLKCSILDACPEDGTCAQTCLETFGEQPTSSACCEGENVACTEDGFCSGSPDCGGVIIQ